MLVDLDHGARLGALGGLLGHRLVLVRVERLARGREAPRCRRAPARRPARRARARTPSSSGAWPSSGPSSARARGCRARAAAPCELGDAALRRRPPSRARRACGSSRSRPACAARARGTRRARRLAEQLLEVVPSSASRRRSRSARLTRAPAAPLAACLGAGERLARAGRSAARSRPGPPLGCSSSVVAVGVTLGWLITSARRRPRRRRPPPRQRRRGAVAVPAPLRRPAARPAPGRAGTSARRPRGRRSAAPRSSR